MKKCWRCRIFGHKYYRGLASWVCTKKCCQGKADAVKPAPRPDFFDLELDEYRDRED